MVANPVATPANQPVTWVELFFDLIFVFSVTQLVGLLHSGFTWASVGQVALVFWFVWFAWGQFTWALNAADTRHHVVQLATLAAAAVAFAMAVSIPDAFHDRAIWFGITYVAVRLIGLGVFMLATSHDSGQKSAVARFATLSIPGLVLVITGGFVGGDAQYWFWGGAIVLDLISANLSTTAGGWNIQHEHFSERHGLFVIIALGESLIIAATGVAGREWTTNLTLFAIASLSLTFGLWWSYFALAKDRLDALVEGLGGDDLANVVRDSFSMFHYPMLLGIIGIAAAIEEGIVHPDVPLHTEVRIALAVGMVLFVAGMAAAIKRAGGALQRPRVLIVALTALAIVFVPDVDAFITILIGLAGLAAIGIVEHVTEERGEERSAEGEGAAETSD